VEKQKGEAAELESWEGKRKWGGTSRSDLLAQYSAAEAGEDEKKKNLGDGAERKREILANCVRSSLTLKKGTTEEMVLKAIGAVPKSKSGKEKEIEARRKNSNRERGQRCRMELSTEALNVGATARKSLLRSYRRGLENVGPKKGGARNYTNPRGNRHMPWPTTRQRTKGDSSLSTGTEK